MTNICPICGKERHPADGTALKAGRLRGDVTRVGVRDSESRPAIASRPAFKAVPVRRGRTRAPEGLVSGE